MVPERFTVVALTGYQIRLDSHGCTGGRKMTDWHVVDERGRTVRVFGTGRTGGSQGLYRRMRQALNYAAELNVADTGERMTP